MLELVASTVIACSALTVTDGDTIKCDGVRMRLLGDGAPYVSGFDTPEISRAKCDAEKRLGRVAKRRLEEIIMIPGMKIENSGSRDPRGRPLVAIRLPNGRTAGAIMIEEGLATVWTPGYRADWCG